MATILSQAMHRAPCGPEGWQLDTVTKDFIFHLSLIFFFPVGAVPIWGQWPMAASRAWLSGGSEVSCHPCAFRWWIPESSQDQSHFPCRRELARFEAAARSHGGKEGGALPASSACQISVTSHRSSPDQLLWVPRFSRARGLVPILLLSRGVSTATREAHEAPSCPQGAPSPAGGEM